MKRFALARKGGPWKEERPKRGAGMDFQGPSAGGGRDFILWGMGIEGPDSGGL